jgi:KUP system potassium uptake protein
MEYDVNVIVPDDIVRITFRLGFRVEQRISLFFRKVVEDMVNKKEIDVTSRYKSLNEYNFVGDFRFVVLEKYLSYENDLPFRERIIMQAYFFIKSFTPSEAKWFGLDTSAVKIEKVPLVIKSVENVSLVRM